MSEAPTYDEVAAAFESLDPHYHSVTTKDALSAHAGSGVKVCVPCGIVLLGAPIAHCIGCDRALVDGTIDAAGRVVVQMQVHYPTCSQRVTVP